ncbi:hypothetical protein ACH41H_14720 [Streptomyces sp. NPDC020800]|uniref:hypothetical protein n=1 Tax=Streptomyces sp. NPDC020800 TaxID=3365092 RepID=UPI0037B74F20
MHETTSPEGHTMYDFEIHRTRTAQLRREAEQDRLAREAVLSRRAARREEAVRRGAQEAESHTDRPRRQRLPRTA